MQKISHDFFTSVHFLSDLLINKDKSQAFYKETLVDKEKNGYKSRIRIHNLVNHSDKPLTDYKDNTSFFVVESALYQSVKSDKEVDLCELDNCGNVLKTLKFPQTPREVTPYQDKWLCLLSINKEEADYFSMTQGEKAEVDQKKKADEDYEIYTEYPFTFNGAGTIDKERTSLFIVDLQTRQFTRLSSATMDVHSYTLIGSTVYYCGADYNHTLQWDNESLHQINLETLKDDCLMDKGFTYRNLFTLHQQLYCLGNPIKHHGSPDEARFHIYKDGVWHMVCDTQFTFFNGVTTDMRQGHYKTSYVDDDVYYTLLNIKGETALASFDGENIKGLIHINGTIDGHVKTKDGFLTICMKDGHLQELYEHTDECTPLTHFNEECVQDIYVAVPEKITVNKEMPIDGWVLKPKDFNPAKTYPGILEIHGGPRGAYGEIFFHEMQLFASNGYFVFFCNPRGSSGKGNAFADLSNNWGRIDYEDIMDFTDEVLKAYPCIDASRLGVTGGSYGGYMTNWIITQTSRFKAAASCRSISNVLTEILNSDYGMDLIYENNFKDERHCLDELWDMSPLKYVDRVKTPTLFIHSDQDYRCTLEQAIQMYTALKLQNIDSKLVVFKGENHELSRSGKPSHRLKRLEEMLQWMNHYLKEEQ